MLSAILSAWVLRPALLGTLAKSEERCRTAAMSVLPHTTACGMHWAVRERASCGLNVQYVNTLHETLVYMHYFEAAIRLVFARL
jgi:hypothetical protein